MKGKSNHPEQKKYNLRKRSEEPLAKKSENLDAPSATQVQDLTDEPLVHQTEAEMQNRVLLIEDNPADARLVKEMVTEARNTTFKLEHTDRLTAGLKLLAEEKFDLLLLDLNLPDSYGLETLEKAQAQSPRTPVIVLTGLEDESLAVRALQLGAQDYLLKGQINSDLLARSILYSLERKRAEEALRSTHDKLEAKIQQRTVELLEANQKLRDKITEHGRAEERFRLVVESAPYAVVTTDQKGKITYINPQTERLFGYSHDELIGQSVEILVPERFRRGHPEHRKDFHADPQVRPMGAGRDLFALRKDGNEFPVEIALTPIHTEEGLVVLSSIVDITQRKRAEQALRESEEKLRAIMDNTADAILVYDELGNIVTINKEAERLFGGNGIKKLKSVWDIVPSEEKANFADMLRDVKEGNRLVDYETERIQADGERIPVSLGLVYVDEEGGRFIATVRDIRERVALRNKIVDFEKAQVFGKMAEGIAHHMGTPLASMLLRVQMLKEDVQELPKHGKLMEKLESIERQIFYGQKVMQRLLKFASKPESIRRPERISIILEDSAEMIKPLLRRPGIQLELSVDKDVKVKADIDLLELVFSDLMMNAVDAMPEGGMLSVNASKKDSEQMVNITISDTGTGIPEDVLPYVFEPFFTTKPAGKGTGLGLSVAKRIVHSHDGEIRIESTEGMGTRVFMKLPIYTEED